MRPFDNFVAAEFPGADETARDEGILHLLIAAEGEVWRLGQRVARVEFEVTHFLSVLFVFDYDFALEVTGERLIYLFVG